MDLSARLEMSVTAPLKPFIPDTNPPVHVFILFSVRFPSEWNLDFWRWSMIAVVAIIESCPWQLRDILSNLPDQSNWGAAASEIDELSSSYKSSSSSSTSLSSSSFSCILSFCREVNKSEAGLFILIYSLPLLWQSHLKSPGNWDCWPPFWDAQASLAPSPVIP